MSDQIKLPVRVEQDKVALGETGDYDFFWILRDADGVQLAWWQDGDAEELIANQIRDALNGRSAPDARLREAIGRLLFHLEREYTGNGSTLHQQALIKDMNAVRAALSEMAPISIKEK